MRITVKTGDASSQAADITDEMLSSAESMLARGKAFLFSSSDAYLQSVSMPLQNMISTGQIGSVSDNQFGTKYTGKVTGVSIDIDGSSQQPSIDLKIDVEIQQ